MLQGRQRGLVGDAMHGSGVVSGSPAIGNLLVTSCKLPRGAQPSGGSSLLGGNPWLVTLRPGLCSRPGTRGGFVP